ncbi:MAG TPA: K(+)-transporting ATPase subunit C [Tepidiformaceae bacterium]|nr:K(+)-transporting ATPase subunit C [Tepidiformaceae bacterium]
MNAALRSWIPELRPLLAVPFLLFLITAVGYPLAVTGVGQAIFGAKANGIIATVDGVPVGSHLVGQEFTSVHYFHGRPSAADYDAAASAGSNLGPTSAKFLDGVADDLATAEDESFTGVTQRVETFRRVNGLDADQAVPADAVTASASGLDPHISPANARLQVARVARARGIDEAALTALVEDHVEKAVFGIFGEPRVNVLELNIALDRRFPVASSRQ